MAVLAYLLHSCSHRCFSTYMGEWMAHSMEFELQQSSRRTFCHLLRGRILDILLRGGLGHDSTIRGPLLRVDSSLHQGAQTNAREDSFRHYPVSRYIGSGSHAGEYNEYISSSLSDRRTIVEPVWQRFGRLGFKYCRQLWSYRLLRSEYLGYLLLNRLRRGTIFRSLFSCPFRHLFPSGQDLQCEQPRYEKVGQCDEVPALRHLF